MVPMSSTQRTVPWQPGVVGVIHADQFHPAAHGIPSAKDGQGFLGDGTHHAFTSLWLPLLKAEEPDSRSSRILRFCLNSSPMKPSRSRKHLNSYLGLTASFSFALTRLASLTIRHMAVIRLVKAAQCSASTSPLNQGKEIFSADTSIGRLSTPRASLRSGALASTSLRRLSI